MCEGCEWLWDSGILDTTIGLRFELASMEAWSDNHAIAWALAKDNANRVTEHIHRALCEELMEDTPIVQLLTELLEEIL
tara:strand:- start:1722 stop:1958 length:237 start_codon:yes stop_codon:yes gene_type:complete